MLGASLQPACLPASTAAQTLISHGELRRTLYRVVTTDDSATTEHRPMPRTRPIKRLSEGKLTELRRQLLDLPDRGWIQPSTAGHAVSVVFARKPDDSWRICYDFRGLNAITDLLYQVRIREADWWKTSFRPQLGQFEWKVTPFGLQG